MLSQRTQKQKSLYYVLVCLINSLIHLAYVYNSLALYWGTLFSLFEILMKMLLLYSYSSTTYFGYMYTLFYFSIFLTR